MVPMQLHKHCHSRDLAERWRLAYCIILSPIYSLRNGKRRVPDQKRLGRPIRSTEYSIMSARAAPPRMMLAFALPLLLAQVPGYGVPNYTVTYEMSRSTVVRAWRGAAGLAAARRSHALLCP